MKIGELSKATHTQVETIRYYEREGLLPQTDRTEGNYRVYGHHQYSKSQPLSGWDFFARSP
jgi:DNA-binding transcriptional MerR regulator